MAEPQYIYIREKQLRCSFCDHDRFFTMKTKMTQRVLAVLDLQAFAKPTTSYLCTSCGMVHEFAGR